MNQELSKRQLLELAANSSDATVKRAVENLLFVTQLAHGSNAQDNFALHDFHYGATFSMPPCDHPLEFSVAWANNRFAARCMTYQFIEGTAGDYLNGDITPTYALVSDRNYNGA